jgi:hypothetical protein
VRNQSVVHNFREEGVKHVLARDRLPHTLAYLPRNVAQNGAAAGSRCPLPVSLMARQWCPHNLSLIGCHEARKSTAKFSGRQRHVSL